MGKKPFGTRAAGLIAAGAMAASMCSPVMAFAANGVQDGTQNYGAPLAQEGQDPTFAWTPAANDGNGGAGQIQLVYSTEGGTWQEPGADATDDSDNVAHDNGTYVLTIPKLISYENMNIGPVQTSDNYTVNVRGALEAGKVVNVTAEASGSLTNANQASTDDSAITFATTQGKNQWSANDAFGTLNTDGSLSGTDATDTIAMTGVAKSAGTWTGHVQYSSAIADAS